jgi:hypothetical protein
LYGFMKKMFLPFFDKIFLHKHLVLFFIIPVLLCAADSRAATVTFAWDKSPDPVTGYIVFYGQKSVVSNPSTALDVGNVLQCSIADLLPSYTYYFAVKAYNAYGQSGFSDEIQYTVPAAGSTTTSAVPSTTTMTSILPTTVTISYGGGGGGGGNNGSRSGTTTAATTEMHSTTTTARVPEVEPCPAQYALGVDNPDIDTLREFRDSTLAQSAVGRRIIRIYYDNAGSINEAFERSPALRTVAKSVLEMIAQMVGKY